MEDAPPSVRPPWQPLTFGGVAGFAHSPIQRLATVQFVVALIVAASVVWLAASAWSPVVSEAISHCPPNSEIRGGRLVWTDTAPVLLAENHFLAIAVDPEHSSSLGQTADFQIEWGAREWRIRSLFGYFPVVYSPAGVLSLDKASLGPWWGTWQPVLLTLLAGLVVIGLHFSWVMIAAIYLLPLKFLAYLTDRVVSTGGCFLLAAAALLPGAIFMAGAVALYGGQRINLPGLLFAWGLHLLIGLVYAVGAVWFLPRATPREPENPFRPA